MNMVERLGLAVWVKDLKSARSLGRMGNIHYISKRLKYVYLYVDGKTADQIIHRIERLPYVKRVERSQRMNICFDFNQRINSQQI
ncbi:YlbG family protein [Thermoactinomyces mirandus]|uniref:YlbG family protein n=1 Tax=Thermoactinomyces mirandus TaxID=2756294 RepID=A0A7W2ARD2_9BACL|nr:YlbG family protein [Thermoactinomyces mirandus]MBA4601416.1 YlbG family protein [Thermoactinomyces mirandus]